jgi:3-oxoacyl-[acyl-carrier protein] reductase
MSQKLVGKVAVVTGASKGLGASIAKHLAAEGAAVVVNYASSKAGARQSRGRNHFQRRQAVAVKANVAKKADIDQLFAETKKAFGPVDVLVNNAGIFEFLPIEEINEDSLPSSVWPQCSRPDPHHARSALKYFNPDGGSIINTSSLVSTYTPPGSAVYSATKASVDAITKVFAKELGPRKIRVNSVNPGMVVTEGAQAGGFIEGEFRKQIEKADYHWAASVSPRISPRRWCSSRARTRLD